MQRAGLATSAQWGSRHPGGPMNGSRARLAFLVVVLVASLAAGVHVPAGTASVATGACAGARSSALDFWLGPWRVVDAAGTELGTNKIEKLLKGCAVMEHWRGADGSEGKGLFYLDANTQIWHQLWVTDDTHAVGGIKEKTLVSEPGASAVRFQGTLLTPANVVLLDRTTLAPLPDGRVRQTIEISRNGGQDWKTA